jgi:hypothetical protein
LRRHEPKTLTAKAPAETADAKGWAHLALCNRLRTCRLVPLVPDNGMRKRVDAPSSRAQSAPATRTLIDRGFGRTPLKPVLILPPPTTIHLAAASQFDRSALKLHSLRELLTDNKSAAEQERAIVEAAEAASAAVLEAARKVEEAEDEKRAKRPSSAKGKKKSPAEVQAEKEEEAAFAAAKAERQKAAEAAAAEAARKAREAATSNDVNWLEHLEDRCAPYEWTPLMFAARHGTPALAHRTARAARCGHAAHRLRSAWKRTRCPTSTLRHWRVLRPSQALRRTCSCSSTLVRRCTCVTRATRRRCTMRRVRAASAVWPRYRRCTRPVPTSRPPIDTA